MNKLKNTLLFFCLCFIFKNTKSSNVLIVNLCKHESFEIFHMETTPSRKELSKRLLLGNINQQKIQQVINIKNIDISKKEDIWIKGNSWRRIPKKGHYIALNLTDNNDYILFIKNAKKSNAYGGTLDYDLKTMQIDKEQLFENLTYVHEKLIPTIKKITDSMPTFSTLKLKDCQVFKSKLQELGELKDYYAEYEEKINYFLKTFSYMEQQNQKKFEPDLSLVDISTVLYNQNLQTIEENRENAEKAIQTFLINSKEERKIIDTHKTACKDKATNCKKTKVQLPKQVHMEKKEKQEEGTFNSEENIFFDELEENAKKLRESSEELSSFFETLKEDMPQLAVFSANKKPKKKLKVIEKEKKKTEAIPLHKLITKETIFNLKEVSEKYTINEMQEAISKLTAMIIAVQTTISTTRKKGIKKSKLQEKLHLETLKSAFLFAQGKRRSKLATHSKKK